MEIVAGFGVTGKDLFERNLYERWSEVKEDYWGELKRETVRAVKRLIETRMEVEVTDLIGVQRWKHTAYRPTYRNGHYFRGLLTSMGYIPELKVPRIREGKIEFNIIDKYQRRSPDVDEVVLEMFLSGVSTRRVKEVMEPLVGPGAISAGLVSKITKVLNKQVGRWHHRKLKDEYEYLILDGIYLNAKSPVYKKRRCVLVVYGIKRDGKRELIDYRVAPHGESQSAWENILNSLYNRGLEGRMVKLVAIDGNRGLYNAVKLLYPDAKIQRCWAHKLRNVANKLPRRLQKVCINQARDIYNAEGYSQAMRAFKRWAILWRPVCPEAVKCLEQDLEELLNFYEYPKQLWKKLRTTNIIERVFREVRRRTRPMSCFQNKASVERIIFAIFHRLNRKWENSPICQITQLY